MLEHSRCQFPIGQGFFHAGSVSLGGPSFRYVYDCGSEYRKPLLSAIERYLEEVSGESIDVLFLSHLDSDHVSGLDRLLLFLEAKIVILPYLSPVARLIVIARAVDEGTLDSTFLDFVCDPTGWLLRRGVGQLIYVLPGEPPDGTPPDFTVPLPPDDDNPNFRRDTGREAKEPHVRLDLDVDGLDNVEVESPLKRSYRSKVKTVSCLQSLRFRSVPYGMPNWQFVTYVHPEGERETAFRHVIRRTFGKQLTTNRRFEIDASKISRLLKNPVERDKLAACYTIIRRNRNLTSLCLYSGPIDLTGATTLKTHPWEWPMDNIPVAWIGTGDSDLLTDGRRSAFLNHYSSLTPFVHTMSLPHHGSRHNFHRSLLDIGHVFVAAAGQRSRYKHPHRDVTAAVGHRLHLTTEAPATELWESFIVDQDFRT